MKKFFKDFKVFISRGNILDLAIAVVIGAAFSAIVNSLVNDIIMPLIVWMFPVQDLDSLCVVLRAESAIGAGDALTWNYGKFIAAVINFLLIAFTLFLVLKTFMGIKGIATPKYGKNIGKAEYRAMRKEGKTKEEIKAIDEERELARIEKEEEEKRIAAENTEVALLKKLVALVEEKKEKEEKGKKKED